MKNVSLGISTHYDSGVTSRVALSASNSVVEVHRSQFNSGLWYHVGQLVGDICNFGPSIPYDSGIAPSVALNNKGVVVEMHQTQSPFSSGMYYLVGQIDVNNRIGFKNSHQFSTGNKPSVALNDNNIVVEVHESSGLSSNMWCNVGIVNTYDQTIDFGDGLPYGTGSTPSIAINNNGLVVEVHRSEGASAKLWYHVGTVDLAKKKIDFGSSVHYDSGQTPSVALTEDGYVIEVHQSEAYETLWLRIGQVDAGAKEIKWLYSGCHYGEGTSPSIATNGDMAIEVDEKANSLHYSASMFMDRSNWMQDNLGLIGARKLKEVVLPASHDAGMYMSQDCTSFLDFGANRCNTETQSHPILHQLQNGSRYFDIRPVIYNSQFYTGHFDNSSGLGCNGPLLSDILSQVSSFMQASGDLVILKFSHYYNRDGGTFSFTYNQMEKLCGLVTSALQPLLFCSGSGAGTLADVTINTYISAGGKVLAVFEGLAGALKDKYPGTYSYADLPGTADLVVFDQYADTNNTDALIKNQIAHLTNPDNHQDNLFLLSWALTQSKAEAIACGANLGVITILMLAEQANRVLFSNMVSNLQNNVITQNTIPNLLYIDKYDGFVADAALWLNQNIPFGSPGK